MGRLVPFLGLTMGAVLLDPEQIQLTNGSALAGNDTWRFATPAMLGTKIWMTPNVACASRRAPVRVHRRTGLRQMMRHRVALRSQAMSCSPDALPAC
jgi:hypothetical protein